MTSTSLADDPAPAADAPPTQGDDGTTDRRAHPVLVAATVVATVAGVALRFFTDSPLWLDEVLSVNIASLPLGDIPEALRHDGHPPLFYVLLHGWTELFGTGDVAARSLSGVFGVAALPLAYLAGRRLGGRTVGCYTLILVALSPYAVRYATEVRMYSLVTFLALLFYLAVVRSLEDARPARLGAEPIGEATIKHGALVRRSRTALAEDGRTWRNSSVPVAVVTATLVLTHYWSFYLLLATVGLLALTAFRHPSRRRRAIRTTAAMGIGILAFLPWAGSFLYQLAHTGTPWSRPIEPFDALFDTLLDFGGGKWIGGRLLAPLLAALLVLAVFGRVVDRHRVELDLRTRPEARREIALAGLTLALGVIAAVAASSAYQPRYVAVVFPFVLMVAAFGITRLPLPAMRSIVVGVVIVAGFAGTVRSSVDDRTQGEVVANRIAEEAQPGDVIGYCPDQLGPAVNRALPAGQVELTFPGQEGGLGPRRVEWVDYVDRIEAESPRSFARRLVDRAGDHTVWMVWAENYPGFDERCESILDELEALGRSEQQILDAEPRFYERESLSRFAPSP